MLMLTAAKRMDAAQNTFPAPHVKRADAGEVAQLEHQWCPSNIVDSRRGSVCRAQSFAQRAKSINASRTMSHTECRLLL